MKHEYLKAIQKMRKLEKSINEKEWNKIAKQDNLLSATSLKYISQKDFYVLQKEVKRQDSHFKICY